MKRKRREKIAIAIDEAQRGKTSPLDMLWLNLAIGDLRRAAKKVRLSGYHLDSPIRLEYLQLACKELRATLEETTRELDKLEQEGVPKMRAWLQEREQEEGAA